MILKYYRTFLCIPIIKSGVTHYPMLSLPQINTEIPMYLIYLKLNIMNGLILFLISQNLNLVDLLICMDNILTVLFSKTQIFTILILIPMLNILTFHFTVVFAM